MASFPSARRHTSWVCKTLDGPRLSISVQRRLVREANHFEETALTWTNDPQIVGFAMMDGGAPFILIAGLIGLLGGALWFVVSIVLLFRRKPGPNILPTFVKARRHRFCFASPEEIRPRPRTYQTECFGTRYFLQRVTATDRLERTAHHPRCRWFSDRGLVPRQRRALPCAYRAAAPASRSFLRCSAARNKFCSPRRSAW